MKTHPTYAKLSTLCGFFLVVFLCLPSTSSAQRSHKWSEDFTTNRSIASYEADGFKMIRFRSVIQTGNTKHWLETTEPIDDGKEHAITTPLFYIDIEAGGTPNYNLEFWANGALVSNASGTYSIRFDLVNAGGGVIPNTNSSVQIQSASPRDYKYNTVINKSGWYRIKFTTVVDVPSNNNRKATFMVQSVSLNGRSTDIGFTEDRYATNLRGGAATTLLNGQNFFYVGDDIKFTYNFKINTSDPSKLAKKVIFRIIQPDKVRVVRWQVTKKSGQVGSDGDSEIISMSTLNDNMEFNEDDATLTVFDVEDGDEFEVVLDGIADEVGEGSTNTQMQESENPWDEWDDADPVDYEIIPESTLPVELIYFNAIFKKDVSHLNWATAVEFDNNYFSIERSSDGINYYEIGRVDGKGTSSGKTEYQYIDIRPLKGSSYYRLSQTDFNGQISTFESVRVVAENIQETRLAVLKNPSSRSEVVFTLDSPEVTSFNIRLYDTAGKLIVQSSTDLIENFNNSYILSGLNLSKGVYILSVDNNRERNAIRLLVE